MITALVLLSTLFITQGRNLDEVVDFALLETERQTSALLLAALERGRAAASVVLEAAVWPPSGL